MVVVTQRRTHKRLVDLLLKSRVITKEQAKLAQQEQKRRGGRLADVFVEQRLVSPEQLIIFNNINVPFVNLKKETIQPRVLRLLPETVCRKYHVLPLGASEDAVTVAMEDPRNIQVLDFISAYLKRRVDPMLALRHDIEEALDRYYRASEEIERQLGQVSLRPATPAAGEDSGSIEAIAHAPVVMALNLLIQQAARDRASDIHLEPEDDHLRIRFRIDGILHDVMSVSLSVHQPLISRIKIMAGLNIAERRRPQDGQFTSRDNDRELDIRVSTASTVHGEMAVLRLLDKTFALLTLPNLGFLPEVLDRYRQLLKTPFGMILVSGPTGSGKTTTLYASINQLDRIGRKIITIEDPVEYRFANVSQMQVNERAGMTFATGLRSIMRLDPDVILVGEIRDAETAGIAIQAALTGHLVLSSIHANDTVSAMYRLLDLGIEPFLVASALIGIVAQRMVRRICPNCSLPTTVSPEERLAYEREMGETAEEFLHGTGCNLCAQTGYLGRTGIMEAMLMSEPIRRLLLSGGTPDDMRQQAIQEGTVTLWHDGMTKVKMGITTPYEVIRNVFSIG